MSIKFSYIAEKTIKREKKPKQQLKVNARVNNFFLWRLREKTVCFITDVFLRFCVIQLKSHYKLNFIGMWFADKYTQYSTYSMFTSSSRSSSSIMVLYIWHPQKKSFCIRCVWVRVNDVRSTICTINIQIRSFIARLVWFFPFSAHKAESCELANSYTHLSKSTTNPNQSWEHSTK